MANLITGSRMVFSLFLLICKVFSPQFYTFYLLAGFTDMIDGTVARKTNTTSEFGTRLDTIADMVFTVVCILKILPAIDIPYWILIWIGIIAAIKVINIFLGAFIHKKYMVEHTIVNKVTGFLLFILPFLIPVLDLKYSVSVVCIVATVAAIQEGYYVFIGKSIS